MDQTMNTARHNNRLNTVSSAGPDLLPNRCHFTDEELDFIANSHAKYRIGRDPEGHYT